MHEGLAERIAAMRAAKNLTQAEVATALGINDMWVYDLEAYDDDLPQTLSLHQVCNLAALLDVSPRLLVCGPAMPGEPTTSPEELVQAIHAYLSEHGMTLVKFEDNVGWECGSVLDDPSKLWVDWNLNQTVDACDALGIDWRTVLPALRE